MVALVRRGGVLGTATTATGASGNSEGAVLPAFQDIASSPARYALAVTPHDSNALTEVPKALYVGTAGNVTMRGVDGAADQLWKNVPAGALLPFQAQYVRATGTTAADILALY